MAGVRRSCGTVNVTATDGTRRDSGTGDGGSSTTSPAPPRELPYIGPVTADNPRALAAGAGGALLVGLLATR